MNKKIFIGGTGRSGTSILSKFLGSHNEICKMPGETRFIIDKGGLINLFDALTVNYSFDQSRMALEEFNHFMLKQLVNPYNSPYLSFNFPKTFGKEQYYNNLNIFFNSLVDSEFQGEDFHSKDKFETLSYLLRTNLRFLNSIYIRITKLSKNGSRQLPFYKWPEEKMYIGKFFYNKNELYELMEKFVNSLFLSFSKKNNKIHWCEDTPANIAHLNFLSNTFKGAYFIHIVRNPIGVAYAMKNKLWAPNNYKDIVKFLSNIYEQLIYNREFAEYNNLKYLEIKLEELCTDYMNMKNVILNFLDVSDNFKDDVIFDIDKVDYYKKRLSSKDYNYLRIGLSKYIDFYNYS